MFDLHVHSSPDVMPRRGSDLEIVRWYSEAGFSGCVLKCHYDATTGRAAAAGDAAALRVYGAQVLNQHVGGLNPVAVEAALMMGARVIWMPTTDAHTQAAAGLPRLCLLRPGLPDTTYAIPPVDWSVERQARRILELIADADAVLATGHLSGPEVAWLLEAAQQAGVGRMLLTHPTYTVPAMTTAETRELTARFDCYAEVTAYQLLSQPGCEAAALAAFVAGVGYDRVVLSSDAGQPENPRPPDALVMLIDQLAREGLDRQALVECASTIPERLVTP
jgi:hypothetical protein